MQGKYYTGFEESHTIKSEKSKLNLVYSPLATATNEA